MSTTLVLGATVAETGLVCSARLRTCERPLGTTSPASFAGGRPRASTTRGSGRPARTRPDRPFGRGPEGRRRTARRTCFPVKREPTRMSTAVLLWNELRRLVGRRHLRRRDDRVRSTAAAGRSVTGVSRSGDPAVSGRRRRRTVVFAACDPWLSTRPRPVAVARSPERSSDCRESVGSRSWTRRASLGSDQTLSTGPLARMLQVRASGRPSVPESGRSARLARARGHGDDVPRLYWPRSNSRLQVATIIA
jgi:hypothetical protein